MKKLAQARRSMESVLPKNAKWIKDSAVEFNPDANEVVTKTGHKINYDVLVIAVGLQLNYDKVFLLMNFLFENEADDTFFGVRYLVDSQTNIQNEILKIQFQIPGLEAALLIPNGNVTSIYSVKYVDRHLNALKNFESGNIVFTFPASPVKCPGAPQKICYITEHYLRKTNKREKANIFYNSALPTIFGCKYFADALWIVAKERNVNVKLKTNLVEVRSDKNEAIFANIDHPNERTVVNV